MLSTVKSKRLLRKAKLKVSRVNTRFRFRRTPPRCYRCHETGYKTRDCKSAINRSALCYRSGKKGHKTASGLHDFKQAEGVGDVSTNQQWLGYSKLIRTAGPWPKTYCSSWSKTRRQILSLLVRNTWTLANLIKSETPQARRPSGYVDISRYPTKWPLPCLFFS